MPNQIQMAGGTSEPTAFAPLFTNRIFTGFWSNRSLLRDAATNDYQEHYGMGRQDSLCDGLNTEISTKLTLRRRPGTTIYNSKIFPPIKRFYSFNTFGQANENIRVMADTAATVYDATGPNTQNAIWQKSPGAGSTYFLGVGDILYFTNGVDNKQWDYDNGQVYDWGIPAPTVPPTVTQSPKPNPYPSWQPNTAYETHSPARTGMLIVDNTAALTGIYQTIPVQGGGNVVIGCGENLASGASVGLPPGFNTNNLAVWSTPCNGFAGTDIDGVYASSGGGGFVSSSFQNRQGGLAQSATSNWIAIAWDAAAAANITINTTGGFTQLAFKTANGDDLAFVVGSGANTVVIPVPAGFSTAQMLSIVGMSGCQVSNNALQGVLTSSLSATGAIQNLYTDGRSHNWTGTSNVFAAFWKLGQGTSTSGVTQGTALTIPTTGAGNVALMFSQGITSGSSFTLPAGYSTGNIALTAAMVTYDDAAAGDNNGHGWNVTTTGTQVVSYYRDGSGNQWNGGANIFAVGGITDAAGGSIQFFNGNGTTGGAEPSPWNQALGGITVDSSINWVNIGPSGWRANHNYAQGDVVMGVVRSPAGTPNQFYICTTAGLSASGEPQWASGIGVQILDGSAVWTCQGRALDWGDIGPDTNVTSASTVVDTNGYLQTVGSGGKTGPTEPAWQEELGALTTDNTVTWVNAGSFNAGATGATQYGYAYKNSATKDISEMSPASISVTLSQGSQIIVQGPGTSQAGIDTVIIYRLAQGGSTFLYDTEIPNPGGGQQWTFIDNNPDSALNTEIQAQVNGEGTPLPAGATCMAFHLNRIFVAVKNFVYWSTGPDAIASTSSGMAGFAPTNVQNVQSTVTRFWACSLGLVVFTVRDAYLILGSATADDPLYTVTFIEQLPLLSYDAFTVHNTTPYMLLGNNMLMALDPSAGIVEQGFPIADVLEEDFNPAASYVTWHTQSSSDTALYVADGAGDWYRMAPTSAPESGINWSPKATIPNAGAVQSVEVTPGQVRLLLGTANGGPIMQRDKTVNTDLGVPYAAFGTMGNIVLAQPGQLAALAFITLESPAIGSKPALSLLLGEISGTFETLDRTRQDPPNLPPSKTLYSDRYHVMQSQSPVWCRHFQMKISWPAEDAANELWTFTIFGETWNEMRSQ